MENSPSSSSSHSTPLPPESKTDEFPPGDAQIIQQQNCIREEIARQIPYIGDEEPLSNLASEYENGNSIFKNKIKQLDTTYKSIRRARGDGNCFFRCFMFSYLEHIVVNGDEEEAKRMLSELNNISKLLSKSEYPEFIWEDFLNVFKKQLLDFKQNQLSSSELVRRCRDSDVSDYVVMFFRFVTSCEIQHRFDFFSPFIFGLSNMDVKTFCQTCVEPMGEESDQVQIIALCDVLNIPIRIVYLDRSNFVNDKDHNDDKNNDASHGNGLSLVNYHDFYPIDRHGNDDVNGGNGGNDGNDGLRQNKANKSNDPFIVLLYRPGHYDILYIRQ